MARCAVTMMLRKDGGAPNRQNAIRAEMFCDRVLDD
jgi:hypothetical protein